MPNFTMPTKQTKQSEGPEMWGFAPAEGETKIIAFSGRESAGKTSCSNFLHSLAMMFVLGVTEHAYVDDRGKLILLNRDNEYIEFDLDSKDPGMIEYLQHNVWPFIKKYSFANNLKEICVGVLGLDEKLVYGTQKDKATLTKFNWEDMPTVVEELIDVVEDEPVETAETAEAAETTETPKPAKNKKSVAKKTVKKSVPKTGPMTVRQVIEYVGSELFRHIDNDCWAKSLMRQIKKERVPFAVIDDLRFFNELTAVKDSGGKVIRLTLTSEQGKNNTHVSSTALDNHMDDFDYVLDNGNGMSMEDSFRELLAKLTEWEYFKVVGQSC